jgi:inner membrane protein
VATVFTHAALPLIVARGSTLSRRERLVCAVLACVADLDLLGVAFDVRPGDPWGHRGATHSLAFALVLAAPACVAWRRSWRWFVLAAMSHPLIDLLSEFESGVALLAPWAERLHFVIRPVPALPLGVPEFFSPIGALVLLNEVLFVLAPVALAVALLRARGDSRRLLQRFTAAALWCVGSVCAGALWPDQIAPRRVRVFELSNDVPRTPAPGVPADGWLTRWDELRPLTGRALTPERTPWSSGFFPSWYGREAGRWQDSRLTLISRTLFGARPPSEAEVKAMSAAELARLSPIEKYDVLMGDLTFKATRESLSTSHNQRPRPRFWNGLCNGISAAAMERPEPVLDVDAVSPSGQPVRFFPLDVKALLGLGYYFPASDVELGESCQVVVFDPARVCAMSPVLLTLATANALGRARRSFQLDVHASMQAQYYAVASAEIAVLRDAYDAPPGLLAGAVKLVDVELRYELSATTLPDRVGDTPAVGGRHAPVGLRPVPFAWKATLALDASGALIGGRWDGDGPDSLVFPSGGPELLEERVLAVNPGVTWSVIDSLARRSAGE